MDPIHVFYVPYMYIPKSCAFHGHERERFEVKFEVTQNIEGSKGYEPMAGSAHYGSFHAWGCKNGCKSRLLDRSQTHKHMIFFFFFFLFF